MDIDIIRMSASRPDLFKISTQSLLEKLKFAGKFNWFLHEDDLNQNTSVEVVKIAKEFNIFKEIMVDSPPIGQAQSLNKLMSKVTTEFFIHWEDDFKLLHAVDLNEILYLFKENNDVNQICFHKRQIMSEKPGFKKIQVKKSGFDLTTNPHWVLIPAIWRKSFIMKYWKNLEDPINWAINKAIRGDKLKSAEWVIKNTGTYYWGPIEGKQMVEHIGKDRSVRVGAEQLNWEK